jgi:hypothetical protein
VSVEDDDARAFLIGLGVDPDVVTSVDFIAQCGACSRGDHANCSGWCLECPTCNAPAEPAPTEGGT